eukprot:1156849-Pelagomonas_calceolata.AAC.6
MEPHTKKASRLQHSVQNLTRSAQSTQNTLHQARHSACLIILLASSHQPSLEPPCLGPPLMVLAPARVMKDNRCGHGPVSIPEWLYAKHYIREQHKN